MLRGPRFSGPETSSALSANGLVRTHHNRPIAANSVPLEPDLPLQALHRLYVHVVRKNLPHVPFTRGQVSLGRSQTLHAFGRFCAPTSRQEFRLRTFARVGIVVLLGRARMRGLAEQRVPRRHSGRGRLFALERIATRLVCHYLTLWGTGVLVASRGADQRRLGDGLLRQSPRRRGGRYRARSGLLLILFHRGELVISHANHCEPSGWARVKNLPDFGEIMKLFANPI